MTKGATVFPMTQKVLIVGSVAFDIIFSIPQKFQDSIPVTDGKIKNFNASYMAQSKQEAPGGTAGNIAHWFLKNGKRCDVFTAAGKDFETKGYKQKLETAGANISGPTGDYTANAYMISDNDNQQLIIWQPNTWEMIDDTNMTDFYDSQQLADFDIAIFSVLVPDTMKKHLETFRSHNKKATVFFDPGQVTPLYDAGSFQHCAQHADVVIGNEVEFTHFKQFCPSFSNEWDINPHLEIPKKSEIQNRVYIETLGDKGCEVYYLGQQRSYEAAQASTVAETTGAGDAFRAGIISEMALGKTLHESIPLGLAYGAKSVESIGPQTN